MNVGRDGEKCDDIIDLMLRDEWKRGGLDGMDELGQLGAERDVVDETGPCCHALHQELATGCLVLGHVLIERGVVRLDGQEKVLCRLMRDRVNGFLKGE